MTFVALLASGITLSISTCLNVWRRSQETAELNQEARAIIELLSRDIRGSYLGLGREAGYFVGSPGTGADVSVDTLEFCTESSAVARVALLPDELRAEWGQDIRPPVTDYVAVRYELVKARTSGPAGLYRTTWVVPIADQWYEEEVPRQALSSEVISGAVVALRFQYFDGEGWLSSWETTPKDRRLPWAVSIDLTLRDARGSDHVYQTIASVAAR